MNFTRYTRRDFSMSLAATLPMLGMTVVESIFLGHASYPEFRIVSKRHHLILLESFTDLCTHFLVSQ